MYISPIDIIYGQLETQMEGDILRAVQSYGINVDKDELIRALQYDREQYYKGYADAAPRWIPVTERLPEEHEKVVCLGCQGGVFIAETRFCCGRVLWNDLSHFGSRKATHWMPLPEPPKT